MNKFAEKLAKIINSSLSNQYPSNELRYAIELIISQGLLILSLIIISRITHTFENLISFIVPLFLLRTLCGGYHAKTFTECFIITNSACFGSIFFSRIVDNDLVYVLIGLLSTIIIFIYSPMTTKNISSRILQRNKYLSIIFAFLLFLCSFYRIDFLFMNYELTALVLLAVATSLLISKFTYPSHES